MLTPFLNQLGALWVAVLLSGVALSSQAGPAPAQPAGSIRGVVLDQDFDAPLPSALVSVVETGQEVRTTDQGNYVLRDVPPGRYTLVFAKEGYVRQVRTDVVVRAGQLTDVDARLAGDFTEMEEFVVQDPLRVGGGTEAALLELRLESAGMLDSIGSDLMSRAGASDAASALKLVSGASVQDGKFAVIRGLPDRYVNSQMNGIRLPIADAEKRAVELDQFPSPVIESIQVSKTFTPDQQGDASGGAVNLVLKGIPDETILDFQAQYSYDTNVAGRDDFLSYDGGGVGLLGFDDGGRDEQLDSLGGNWDGAVGVSKVQAPIDFKWSGAAGGRHELDNGWLFGGFASLFYERDSSYHDDGVDDSRWVDGAGQGLTPQYSQGAPQQGEFKTALFDITEASETVQWGGLGSAGLEMDRSSLDLTYLYTHTAQDTATLAEDTRGKEHYFPGYDPDDPLDPGNAPDNQGAAPYLRTQTLEYTERTTQTTQLRGSHALPFRERDLGGSFRLLEPRLEWRVAYSVAALYQPDKRQFGSQWIAPGFDDGDLSNPFYLPFKPSANINFGNLQRTWRDIEEASTTAGLDLELPFEQWSDTEGYAKLGLFGDWTEREYEQDGYSNFGDTSGAGGLGWDEYWSDIFPDQNHPITESLRDVDYEGDLEITAAYGMLDLPLSTTLSVVGGARFETTDITTTNDPEALATWFPPGAINFEFFDEPGDGDAKFSQEDVLPSIGLVYEPVEQLTFRASFSKTVARQTFRELSPTLQEEFLGGPIFIGNPDLEMSNVDNYDLRVDYRPYPGGLLSASFFHKDIENPIEYVQKIITFNFTTPVNYPEGELTGFELEARQDLGLWSDRLTGFGLGANATFIDSKVRLTDEEIEDFADPLVGAPMTTRDMTGAPEYLYNLFLTYDLPTRDMQMALFYTVQGDTLSAGAGLSQSRFVPSVYDTEFGTLNFSLSKRISPSASLKFQAKNLTNPEIESVYRSDFTGGDVTHTSYTKGREFSIGLSMKF